MRTHVRLSVGGREVTDPVVLSLFADKDGWCVGLDGGAFGRRRNA